ncbi:hypothetical protein MMC14_007277 [Varicellaria rhodocarpa]|nr:hypothetical protein [Varicellaria rhodocarpa]
MSPATTTPNPTSTQDHDRDPITTHVLDSTTGLPAPSIPVRLDLLNEDGNIDENVYFTAVTSADGRITNWTAGGDHATGGHEAGSMKGYWRWWQGFLLDMGGERKPLTWSLKFDTLAYWGEGKTFYPQVEVRFFTSGEGEENRDHYHVPILLGPWGYTTYRGS